MGLKSRHAKLAPGVPLDPRSDGVLLQFQVPFFITPESDGDKISSEGNEILVKSAQ